MKARVLYDGVRFLLLMLLLLTVVPPLSAQESTSDPIANLMAQMSPEAKVGQLVLVAFPGTDVGDTSEIASLIRDYWIGGVLLTPENGNFGGTVIAPSDLLSVTNNIQTQAWEAAETQSSSAVGESSLPYRPPYVPMLIATRPGESVGLQPTDFVSGASSMPTPMSLGATWDPSLSESVGAVLGRELAALGINFYLGPDLDVLYTPRPGDPADLGTRVFGGDPFWVGEMGTAFISGLHQGSEGRLLVAPRHLPGLGSADRPLAEEVPTVQKPLEQLKQIELAPFFAAAEVPPGAPSAADAFLVTHIRYRGFQGNIRQTTRPISLDAQALQLVTSLDEVEPWRTEGGILVADNLGLPSIHQFYDPRGLFFNARRVMQDALTAGNDLLILDGFAADDDWETHFTNVRDTLKFLASRYKEEAAIKAVVDAAVYRILKMKLRIYPEFTLTNALNAESDLNERLGGEQLISAEVALRALTLIAPLSDDALPSPPQEGGDIVVFTQERQVDLGEDSGSLALMNSNIIADTMMRFYGPQGTGVVRINAIQSFSFEELFQALEVGPEAAARPTGDEAEDELPFPVATAIFESLQRARWIVFASTGFDEADVGATALEGFLAEQANLLDGQIAVLAFGPPYELDSTEISKLDLYYGLFSPGSAFVEAGVRALFQDLPTPGDSPVDVPALNYFISAQTMPDANQTISLSVVDEAGEVLTQSARSAIQVGDLINIRTDVIVDRNGRVVPDDTPVQFFLNYPQEGLERKLVGETYEGVAAASVTLERTGELLITAQSEPAVSSVRLELTIRDDGVTITEIEPTPTPTLTPSPTPTATPSPTATPEPIPPKSQLPELMQLPAPERGKLIWWGLVGAGAVVALGFLWGRGQSLPADVAMMVALIGSAGGLVGYIVLMGVARWWLPVLYYALVGREFVAGLVVAVCGGFSAMMAIWVFHNQEPRRREHPRRMSSSYSSRESYTVGD